MVAVRGQWSTTKEVIRFYWTVPTLEQRMERDVGGANGVSQSLEELHALSKTHTEMCVSPKYLCKYICIYPITECGCIKATDSLYFLWHSGRECKHGQIGRAECECDECVGYYVLVYLVYSNWQADGALQFWIPRLTHWLTDWLTRLKSLWYLSTACLTSSRHVARISRRQRVVYYTQSSNMTENRVPRTENPRIERLGIGNREHRTNHTHTRRR